MTTDVKPQHRHLAGLHDRQRAAVEAEIGAALDEAVKLHDSGLMTWEDVAARLRENPATACGRSGQPWSGPGIYLAVRRHRKPR